MQGIFSPYYGLEDCHGYGERLSEYLFDNGHNICAVPAVMVDRLRQIQRIQRKVIPWMRLGWQRS